jgi:tetratricopeptide (TPR) repeat protein
MSFVRFMAVSMSLWGIACTAGSSAFERGNDARRAHDWDAAVSHYERAWTEEPDNVDYRIALVRARLAASRAHAAAARKHAESAEFESAIDELELALRYDPTNRYARDELAALRERPPKRRAPDSELRVSRSTPFADGEAILDPTSSEPLHVVFPEGSSLRIVLQSLAELAGVSILFDESFRDRRVAVDLEGVTYREALDIVMLSHGLFYKVLSSTSAIVTPEN